MLVDAFNSAYTQVKPNQTKKKPPKGITFKKRNRERKIFLFLAQKSQYAIHPFTLPDHATSFGKGTQD
jgi:hypothetical protein